MSPVTAGRRHVLVLELWEGRESPCGHRCETRAGACPHERRSRKRRRAAPEVEAEAQEAEAQEAEAQEAEAQEAANAGEARARAS